MKNVLALLSLFFYYKPKDFKKIILGFKSLEKVLDAPKDAFLNLGVNGKHLDAFLEKRKKIEYNIESDIKILSILDKNYPACLKNIYDAPPVIFYKGDINCINDNCIAVIGSRKVSLYGRRVAEDMVKKLCLYFNIVSGLAYGIDGLSHSVTVKNNKKTIAVLGSGIDDKSIYPKANTRLAKEIIASGGLILSEVPPKISAKQFHFPMRNRIISALSKGILIVEGSKKSGTLITAKLGIDFGKDIFAVPNSIYEKNSEGVNYLIKCGANPVTSPDDILDFYGIEQDVRIKSYIPKNNFEKIILDSIKTSALTADNLSELTKISPADIIATLTDLEISGAIKDIGGQRYIKA